MNLQVTPTQPNIIDTKVISYLWLRQIIGFIGILLPLLLVLGTHLLDECSPAIQSSISHYYYTQMHMLFVGLLCVLGAFLITYKGTYNGENYISSFAGICAFLVATFPDTKDCYLPSKEACSFITTKDLNWYVHDIHFSSAVLLFLSFAILSWRYFTKPDNPSNPDKRKMKRRYIAYIVCAIGIIVSLILCGLVMKGILPVSENFRKKSVFHFESTALFFFGFSWLLKGSLMWPNKKFFLPFIIKFFR